MWHSWTSTDLGPALSTAFGVLVVVLIICAIYVCGYRWITGKWPVSVDDWPKKRKPHSLYEVPSHLQSAALRPKS